MNVKTLAVGLSFLYVGVLMFLGREFHSGQYDYGFLSAETHPWFGAMVILVGGWFIGRAAD